MVVARPGAVVALGVLTEALRDASSPMRLGVLAFTLVGAAPLLAVGGELTRETLFGASSQSSTGVITFAFRRTQAASA